MRRVLAACCCAALLAGGCGSSEDEPATGATSEPKATATAPARTKPKVDIPQGPAPKTLVKEDLEVGKGAVAEPGDKLTVHYVGVLYENGKQFDASWDKGEPLTFILQAEEVIDGWDEGLEGMKAGGRRKLVIPARLAYGAKGSPPAIPANAPLVFVVDLLRVR